MKIAIIEDEHPAMEQLEAAVRRYDPDITVVARLDTIAASVDWLTANPAPDLILCDIQLSDGLALTVFEQVKVPCPIVFCTAYDQYWAEAFAAGGIDYVLKPIEDARLARALDKYRDLQYHFAGRLEALIDHIGARPTRGFKSRLLVKRGLDHISLGVEDVA